MVAAARTVHMAARATPAFDKIICLGKNYLEHARELGDAVPDKPVLFIKPPSSAVVCSERGGTCSVSLPRERGTVHYECEVCLRLGPDTGIVDVSLGLDLTLRDVQAKLKKNGHSWELGKVFPDAAVLGPWVPHDSFDWMNAEFFFELDGKAVQRGRVSQQMLAPQLALEYIRSVFPVCAHDVVMTGTPAGVGPVSPGQQGMLRWGNHLLYTVDFV
ncbi:hypothetical protein WJX81_002528 [Elliptochloris bilobata]|uniref:Fumarylacetoacetase-like C-terminal domain-containing protein n=1 Tax=Elliptochloris bilobata TaxID=381761 RepID=A0AAW1SI96_9CHLO